MVSENAVGAATGDGIAFDPGRVPLCYEGVRTRRMLAFCVDVALIIVLMILATAVIGLLGLFTLGLGWLLLPLVWPFLAILYTMFTLGGSQSATPGMALMGLVMRTWQGAPIYPILGAMHGLLFWFSVTLLTPFILLISLMNPRKRLLHDMILGTVLVRAAALEDGG